MTWAIRPRRWAAKFSWRSWFCVEGPRRTQFVRIALIASKSRRAMLGRELTTTPVTVCRWLLRMTLRLALVQGESFGADDLAHQGKKHRQAPQKLLVSRKSEIIGVTGVLRPKAAGQPRQSQVEGKSRQVCQGGGRGGPLRQATAQVGLEIGVGTALADKAGRQGRRGQPAQPDRRLAQYPSERKMAVTRFSETLG